MDQRTFPPVVIQRLTPLLDGGRYPVKRAVGEDVVVEADVFKDGHDHVAAMLKWRKSGADGWNETPMTPLPNDRWTGTCSFYECGMHEVTIEAWGDAFSTWRDEFSKKFEAGIQDLWSEMLEGAAMVEAAAERAGSGDDAVRLREIAELLRKSEPAKAYEVSCWSELDGLMRSWPDRSVTAEYTPYASVRVDRERAVFASWYEFFPRSAEGRSDGGSTFRDCLGRIDDAKAMGFDVVYFPPIHPVGETNRKGKNNARQGEPGDPGVPYAIGNRHQNCPNGGGHCDVAPELGTLRDFEWLVREVKKRDMEIALDFAINCSPDHPYVEKHPDWFFQRPDGTIKYAENPPKKYEDVYPLNFHCADWRSLWDEMVEIILFWSSKGVRIFRVDNPHTKPVSFWEYLIGRVHGRYPDVVFLSEAFTRPKMMQVLAKAGFTQSYTYFTWRNTRHELEEYLTELTQGEMAEYFRGHFFTNTPDILPYYLQSGGRTAFMVRSALAATLSPLYGIYSGFELCENEPIPGKEEYMDSEKYQFKGRDWDAPGNIKNWISRLNRIRHGNRALQEYRNLRFHESDNENILFYSKVTRSRDNMVLVAVNLDPFHGHHGHVHVPLERLGFGAAETYQVHDLMSDERYLWQGSRNYISLPKDQPAHVFRVRRWISREQNFDYFL